MRTDLVAGEQTLLETGAYDEHWRLKIANGDGTLIDLSTRLRGGSVRLPNPDSPIGTAAVTLQREIGNDASASLSPLVASSLNVLDDDVTPSPLIQIGRAATLELAITARGGARPAGGSTSWHEIIGGYVKQPSWPNRYGDITVELHDGAYRLIRTFVESPETYVVGTTIEATIQAVLDDVMGSGVYTLVVDDVAGGGTTGEALSVNYLPEIVPVWSAIQALAASIGWTLWYRYNGSGVAKLTLTEPRRAKTSADYTFTLAQFADIEALTIIEEDIRNVVVISYVDTAGADQSVTSEDATSITAYGGIRRFMKIAEGTESPIRSQASAETLRDAALADLKDPDADQAIKTIGAWWPGEASVDLYGFDANAFLYDSTQKLAPYSIDLTFEVGTLASSVIRTRGKPSAGSGLWRERGGTLQDDVEVAARFDIKNFREISRSATKIKYGWTLGPNLSMSFIHDFQESQPFSVDKWPVATRHPEVINTTDTDVEYEVAIPAFGFVGYLQVEGRKADGSFGDMVRVNIFPLNEDFITPTIQPTSKQVGTTGTITLVITDPQSLVTGTAFQPDTGPGDFDLTTNPSTWAVYDVVAPYTLTDTVTITAKHTSRIGYAVQYTDVDGATAYIRDVVEFDADHVAEIESINAHYTSAGAVLVVGQGDEDAANLYTTVKVGSTPLDPTAGVNDGTVAGRNGLITTAVIAALGDTVFVKMVGANSAAALGPVVEQRFQRGDSVTTPFVVQINHDAGATPALDLTIQDPSKSITAIEFQEKTGPGDYGGSWITTWDRSTGTPGSSVSLTRGEDVVYAGKHNVAIKVRISYADDLGATKYWEQPFTWDSDHDAELTGLSIGFDVDGKVSLSWAGDEDFVQGYATVSTNAEPSAPTAISNDGVLVGRSGIGVFDGSGTFTEIKAQIGEYVHVKVVGENSAAVVNAEVFEAKRFRGDAEWHTPSFYITATRSGNTITVSISGKDLSDAMTAFSHSYSYPDGAGGTTSASASTTWSSGAWTAGSTRVWTVTKALTVLPGVTGQFSFLATYKDELGASRTKGVTIALENIDQVEKIITVPASDLLPKDEGQSWNVSGGAAYPGTTATTATFTGAVVLPPGAILQHFLTKGARQASADSLVIKLHYGVYTSAASLPATLQVTLATLTHATLAWNWTTQQALSIAHTVTAGVPLYINVAVYDDTGTILSAFAYARITYDAPTFAKTI